MVLRGTIVNSTYGTNKKLHIYLNQITNNIWSYLLWSRVVVVFSLTM